MSDALKGYFEALDRLKQRKAKINNDTVAVEAGRKKGSIKKSRLQFASLIAAIEEASKQAEPARVDPKEQLAKAKAVNKALQADLDAALGRELSLVREVFELRRELASIRGGRVIGILKPGAM